jgi:hypothetical protein
MTDPLKLTPEQCEAAINAIVARRNAMIAQWADRPDTYYPSNTPGLLEKIDSDLRVLRRLQGDIGASPLSNGDLADLKRVPAWVREHV